MKVNKYLRELRDIAIGTLIILMFTIMLGKLNINIKSTEPKNDNQNNKVESSEQDSKKVAESTEKDSNGSDVVLNGNGKVKVYITSEDRIEELNVEDYVAGVVSSEMPVSFDMEALKAQAVAARTYMASKLMNKCNKNADADVCDSTHCQVYMSKEKRISNWEEGKGEEYWNKIQEAVKSTEGQVLSYNGELVLYPQFFSTSSGKTENSNDANWGDIPYLKSVDSPGEEIAPKFTSEKEVPIDTIIEKLNEKFPNEGIDINNIQDKVEIVSRSEAGGIKEIRVGSSKILGSDFRFLIGLNSTNFTYSVNGNNVVFSCKGYGHGVGMSQWGANVMSKNGSTYDEILKHYYSGVDISNLKFKQ